MPPKRSKANIQYGRGLIDGLVNGAVNLARSGNISKVASVLPGISAAAPVLAAFGLGKKKKAPRRKKQSGAGKKKVVG